jgi:hypothetical protein
VQQAREAARRSECRNKFKQLGLALHNYLDAQGAFPAATIGQGYCTSGIGTDTISSGSGLVLLLPYVDQAGIYNQLDFTKAFDDYQYASGPQRPLSGNDATANASVVNRVMSIYSCPSDPGPIGASTSTTYNLPGGKPDHRTSYDFVVYRNSYSVCNSWMTRSATQRTMFGDGSCATPAMVIDGLSNTAMMLETRKACCGNGNNANWGGRGYVQVGLSLSGVTPNMTLRYSSTYLPDGFKEFAPMLGDWGTAGSWHQGGLNLVLGDGSVRFFSDNADATIRANLDRMADGQLIGDW